MKSSLKLSFASAATVLAVGIMTVLPTSAHADYVWSVGDGIWDTATSNWTGDGTEWANGPGSTAFFNGGGTPTITIGESLDIGALQFGSSAGSYTFDNNSGYALDFTGAGISSATANAQLVSSNGVITFKNSASAGDSTILISSSGEVTFQNTATAGTSAIVNVGQLNFGGGSTAGAAAIDNQGGSVNFVGAASGGTATLLNGGFLDLTASTAGTVTLTSLTNSSGGYSGAVLLGTNTLQLSGGLTLSGTAIPLNKDLLDFGLVTPGTSGEIKLTGGTFYGASTNGVEITLSSPGPVTAGTYTLIDWTGLTASGVDLGDFYLDPAQLPALGLLPSTHLEIQGQTLVLVAVPEPATFAMPLVGALGLIWLRRRNTRLAV
jgi:hypothetical protein